MKSMWNEVKFQGKRKSLPAWGVWIEIGKIMYHAFGTWSLPAWGVWIEIHAVTPHISPKEGHSPHGECGLKSLGVKQEFTRDAVTPRMGSVD